MYENLMIHNFESSKYALYVFIIIIYAIQHLYNILQHIFFYNLLCLFVTLSRYLKYTAMIIFPVTSLWRHYTS